MQDVDLLAPQLVLGQERLQALQDPDPLLLLRFVLRQDEERHGGELRDQLRGRDLLTSTAENRSGSKVRWQGSTGDGVSHPEDAGDVLPGGVDHVGLQHGADGQIFIPAVEQIVLKNVVLGTDGSNPPTPGTPGSPEVQDQAGHHPRLSRLGLWNVVEEQLTVGDHGERSLPALLHAAGLRDLTTNTNRRIKRLACRSRAGAAPQRSYPDVALVRRAEAPVDVDALRPLGLLCRDGADRGGVVFAGDVTDEGAH